MPSMWIKRDLSNILKKNQDLIQILIGPRQVGKTSLLEHLSKDFDYVTLDDLSARELAQKDPQLFLSQFKNQKVVIDEAQYAPNLFPELKKKSDQLKKELNKKQTVFRLTGSNQILMDKAVKEGLTGRASFFDLTTLSLSEILSSVSISPIQALYQGGWPELYAYPETDSNKYLNDYIRSYIEKDIILTAGIQKSSAFLKFLKLLAGRVSQLVNFSELGKDVGINANTISDWISILERMKIISLVQPFQTNLSKRLIKSPKVFFLDTGLACRLQGWTDPKPILTSPQLGFLFENFVFTEIYKYINNFQKNWEIFHWRTRDKEEVDFLVQIENSKYLAIEAKVSPQKFLDTTKLPHFYKIFSSKDLINTVVCHFEGDRIWDNKIPIFNLKEFLLRVQM